MTEHNACSSESSDKLQFKSNCCGSADTSTVAQDPPAKPDTASCCGSAVQQAPSGTDNCCSTPENKIDWLLWGSLSLVVVGYVLFLAVVGDRALEHGAASWWLIASHSIFELINTMWFSVILAVVFVGVLSQVPQSLVMAVLGKGGSVSGLARATAAGVLMDLCSHGILMVGMKLYQKGASLGQTMAFLVASPWNSLSLTVILFALIGWQWTLAFIVLSMVLAMTTGWIFDRLVALNHLPVNGQSGAEVLETHGSAWQLAKQHWRSMQWNRTLFKSMAQEAISGSRIVLRWLLFGVVLASLIRAFVSPEVFQTWLGPTALGLAITLVAATIIEVCSEGSAPIAADIMNRTSAPGNGFAFLMTGVATDYTEVMVIKDTMSSWKVALFLPLITVPQVVVVALILNTMG